MRRLPVGMMKQEAEEEEDEEEETQEKHPTKWPSSIQRKRLLG
jgi:hypothetical protein